MRDFNSLSKKDLIDILEGLRGVLDSPSQQVIAPTHNSIDNQQSDLENIIGTIPFLLLNNQIFERNSDIADFAKKLDIIIPSPEKKKREDIIGRVVSAIARFDTRRIAELNFAIKTLKKTDIKKGKSNFFKDWENVIKQMQL